MSKRIPWNPWRSVAVLLMLLVGGTALAAGYSFMTDPSGSGLGISQDYLRHSPFKDFRIPGIFLFVFNGLLNVVAIAFTLIRSPHYPAMIFVQGGILIAWILVQMLLVRDVNMLHAVCLITGSALILCGRRLQAGSEATAHRSRGTSKSAIQNHSYDI